MDADNFLPFEAQLLGWHYDLGCLMDEYFNLIYYWDYIPSLTELREVCEKLIKERENATIR